MDTNKSHNMSRETLVILEVLDRQDEARKMEIKGVQEKLTAEFESLSARMRSLEKNMDKYAEAKIVQNGRVDKLEKRVKFVGWVLDNPWKSIIIIIAFIGGVVALYENFEFKDMAQFIKLII